jgi:hypothetical protein
MNLGFIILAHNNPAAIRRLTDILTSDGDRVVIHFDSGASAADLLAVQQIASEKPNQIHVISKVHCVWGEWSLVKAVLLAVREFKGMSNPPDYVHLMSGADFIIRPLVQLKEFLRKNPSLDFIECCDISKQAWVRGGLEEERFQFYFPFNFRTNRKAFDRLVHWQRKYKIRRRMPLGLKPHMGSQWWTLRWSTCEKVLDFTAANPKVPGFFKTTWIPDESYFQTIIAKLVPHSEIANLQLMFHHLTPSGRPYVFYNDHLPIFRKTPHFFIRKVSPDASLLWEFLSKPGFHSKRIPRIKYLHSIRDYLRNRIDDNHEHKLSVPGHPDLWYGPELKACKRPVIMLFLSGVTQLTEIEALFNKHTSYAWLGRPFAPKSISIPNEFLSQMGLSPSSWKIRDYFRQQFIYEMLKVVPTNKIPIVAVLPIEDAPDLDAFTSIGLFIPLIVQADSLESYVYAQRFEAATTGNNHNFYSRYAHKIDQRDLNQFIDEVPSHLETMKKNPNITSTDTANAMNYFLNAGRSENAGMFQASRLSKHPDSCYRSRLKECKSPVIMLFLSSVTQLTEIEAMLIEHPSYAWLGRPFAPKSISIPDTFLSQMGISQSSWKTRDYFTQQFIYEMLKVVPSRKISIIAVLTPEDTPDIDSFKNLEMFIPLTVHAESMDSSINTLIFEDETEGISCGFYAETVQKIDQLELKQFLDEFPGHLETILKVPNITYTDVISAISYLLDAGSSKRTGSPSDLLGI